MIMLKNAVNYGLLVTLLMINVWLWTLCCHLISQWFNVLPLYATRMCYLRQDHNITAGCTNILNHNLTTFFTPPCVCGPPTHPLLLLDFFHLVRWLMFKSRRNIIISHYILLCVFTVQCSCIRVLLTLKWLWKKKKKTD